MTDSDPSDSWKPEDGAGYIPTEEGGSNQGAVPIEELEALVQEFQDMAEVAGPEEFVIAYENAADELQEVLDRYE